MQILSLVSHGNMYGEGIQLLIRYLLGELVHNILFRGAKPDELYIPAFEKRFGDELIVLASYVTDRIISLQLTGRCILLDLSKLVELVEGYNIAESRF